MRLKKYIKAGYKGLPGSHERTTGRGNVQARRGLSES